MTPTKIKTPTKETYRRAASPALAIITAFFDDPKNRVAFEKWLNDKKRKEETA